METGLKIRKVLPAEIDRKHERNLPPNDRQIATGFILPWLAKAVYSYLLLLETFVLGENQVGFAAGENERNDNNKKTVVIN